MRLTRFLATAAAVAISSTALIGIGAAPASAASDVGPKNSTDGYLTNVEITHQSNLGRSVTITGDVAKVPTSSCNYQSVSVRAGSARQVVTAPTSFTLEVTGLKDGVNTVRVYLYKWSTGCGGPGNWSQNYGSVTFEVTIDSTFTSWVESIDHPQRTAVLAGKGIPGASVVVWYHDPDGDMTGPPVGDPIVVDSNGDWSFVLTGLDDGESPVWVSHHYMGVRTVDALTVVIDPQMVPVADPMIAGGFGVLLLAAGSVALRRRVRA